MGIPATLANEYIGMKILELIHPLHYPIALNKNEKILTFK